MSIEGKRLTHRGGWFIARLTTGNVRRVLEREVAVPLLPAKFAANAKVVPFDTACSALRELGFDVPAGFASPSVARIFLDSNRRLTPTKIKRFLELVNGGA